MPRIIFEAVLDSSGAVTGLKKLEVGLETLGQSTGKAATEMRSSERELKRLLDRLEPARVAAEKFTRQKELLANALKEGAISSDRYNAAVKTLESQNNKATTGLSRMAGELSKQIAIYASVTIAARALWQAVQEGIVGFAEEERGLNLLAQTVASYGGNAAEATAQTRELADSVRNRGLFDDSEVIKTVREMTNLTGDFGQALSATTLASDIAAKTGQDLASVQSILGDVIAGNVTRMKAALKTFEINNAEIKTGTQLMDALEKKYRGAADTIDDTQSKIKKLSFAFDEAKETLASGFAPAIDVVISAFRGLMAAGITVVATLKTIVTWVGGVVAAIVNGFGKLDWKALLTGRFADFARSAQAGKKELLSVMGDTAQASEDIWDKAWKQIEDLYAEGAKSAAKTHEKIAVTEAKKTGEKTAKTLKDSYEETLKTHPTFEDLAAWAIDAEGFKKAAGKAGEAFAVNFMTETQVWMSRHGVEIVPPSEIFKEPAKEAGQAFSDVFAESFADGFLGWLQGDDFSNIWTGLWEALAGAAAAQLGKAIEALFKGASFTEAMQTGGFYNPQGEGVQGKYGGAIGAGGALLGAYNVRRKEPSPWVGAVAGAASGFAAGGWIGAIIGAIAGYLTTPSTAKHGYSYGFRGTEGYVGEVSGGITKEQEKDLQRTMTAVYRTTAFAFRDILKQLGVAPGALKEVTVPTVFGKAGDPVQVLTQFIKGELPRKVFEVYRDTLTEALTQFKVGDKFAVSAKKAEELMSNFTNLPFDQAMQQLQAYVAALVALDEVYDDLTRSLDELKAEVGATMRDAWTASVDDALEGIRDLSEGLDQLTTEEQVKRAEEIANIARQQYESNLQYLSQLLSISEQVGQSFEQMFMGWEETKAGELGNENLARWYEQQIYKFQDLLAQAASPEQAQQIMAQLQQFYTALWQLGGQLPSVGGFSWRDFVEEQARASKDLFDKLMTQWMEEVQARNQELADALGAVTSALTGEAASRQEVTNELDREIPLRRDLNDLLDEERGARSALIESLVYLAESAGAAGVALSDIQSGAGGGLASTQTVRRSA